MKIQTATRSAGRLIHDGALALAKMTAYGVRIDVGYLNSQILQTEKEIEEIKKRMESDKVWGMMQRTFGNRAKINSREQMANIVFDQLQYKRGRSLAKKDRKNEYGGRMKPKLDVAAFSLCDLEFVKDFIGWKRREKMLTTYFYDIRRNLVGERIHPFFHLNRIVSYRSSSSDNNIQNVPTRNREIADRIRRCYIPDDGCDIVEVDYGQAEVRSACCYNHDPRLIHDFAEGKGDAHGDTAELIFGTKAPQKGDDASAFKFWKVIRDWIKNRFVFPQFFGSTYHNCGPHIWDAVEKGPLMPDGVITVREHLASQGITKLGDPDDEIPAKNTFLYRVMKVEENFWNERFHVYTAWKDRWYKEYLKNGWAPCHSGFVFSGLMNRNDVLNYPIQGFAFHWQLESCIEAIRRIEKYKMKSRLWAEIHDSNNANVPHKERDDYCSMMVDIMTNHVVKKWQDKIAVKLVAEIEVCPDGSPWCEKKNYICQGGIWQKAA